MSKRILVLGGGPSGLVAARTLSSLGAQVQLLEKGEELGGHLLDICELFPTRQTAVEVLATQLLRVAEDPNIMVRTQADIENLEGEQGCFRATLTNGEVEEVDSIILATGFDVYDPLLMPEYSALQTDRVMSGLEFEKRLAKGDNPLEPFGKLCSVSIILCAGSRDESHNPHCCQVGCRVGLHQADMIQRYSSDDTQVYLCYVDVRAHGKGGEAFYRETREKGLHILKGRPSEITFDPLDSTLKYVIHDQITRKLLEIESDIVILQTASIPTKGTGKLATMMGIELDSEGFFLSPNHFEQSRSTRPGIYLAGGCAGPTSLPEAMNLGARAALEAFEGL